jgi:hypothetical protein
MTPFPGYIRNHGHYNPNQKPDGSTVYEHLQKVLAANPDLKLVRNAPPVTEGKKYDPVTQSLVDLEPGDITPEMQRELDAEKKRTAILQGMPSLKIVEEDIDNISSLSDAKVFLRKLTTVACYLSKNTGGG